MELLEDLIKASLAKITCVDKKDGTIRLPVDYKELNAATKISPFLLQNFDKFKLMVGRASI